MAVVSSWPVCRVAWGPAGSLGVQPHPHDRSQQAATLWSFTHQISFLQVSQLPSIFFSCLFGKLTRCPCEPFMKAFFKWLPFPFPPLEVPAHPKISPDPKWQGEICKEPRCISDQCSDWGLTAYLLTAAVCGLWKWDGPNFIQQKAMGIPHTVEKAGHCTHVFNMNLCVPEIGESLERKRCRLLYWYVPSYMSRYLL